MSSKLSYDTFLQILDYLHEDYNALFMCSLTNKELNKFATKLLYFHVVFSPDFSPVLNLREKSFPPSGALTSASACYPDHVISLEISGFLPSRPAPYNHYTPFFEKAVRSFRNLRAIKITPVKYHQDMFVGVLSALKTCAYLDELAVNSSCLDEVTAPLTAELMVSKLTLVDPTRAILLLLPDWLSRLSGRLIELHLKDNCGSITPGVLRSFLPYLHNLYALSLGLSYSLTNGDVLAFLGELPQLRRVHLHYYLQLRPPPMSPVLPNLLYFSVKHSPVYTRTEVNHLCKWIKRIIFSSPLESLRITCDEYAYSGSGAHVSFDGLIDHLTQKHSHTLRILELKSFVGILASQRLFRACTHLEKLTIGVRPKFLEYFPELVLCQPELHTVSLNILQCKPKQKSHYAAESPRLLQEGPHNLRRLAIDDVWWEGQWVCLQGSSATAFVVRQIENTRHQKQA